MANKLVQQNYHEINKKIEYHEKERKRFAELDEKFAEGKKTPEEYTHAGILYMLGVHEAALGMYHTQTEETEKAQQYMNWALESMVDAYEKNPNETYYEHIQIFCENTGLPKPRIEKPEEEKKPKGLWERLKDSIATKIQGTIYGESVVDIIEEAEYTKAIVERETKITDYQKKQLGKAVANALITGLELAAMEFDLPTKKDGKCVSIKAKIPIIDHEACLSHAKLINLMFEIPIEQAYKELQETYTTIVKSLQGKAVDHQGFWFTEGLIRGLRGTLYFPDESMFGDSTSYNPADALEKIIQKIPALAQLQPEDVPKLIKGYGEAKKTGGHLPTQLKKILEDLTGNTETEEGFNKTVNELMGFATYALMKGEKGIEELTTTFEKALIKS